MEKRIGLIVILIVIGLVLSSLVFGQDPKTQGISPSWELGVITSLRGTWEGKGSTYGAKREEPVDIIFDDVDRIPLRGRVIGIKTREFEAVIDGDKLILTLDNGWVINLKMKVANGAVSHLSGEYKKSAAFGSSTGIMTLRKKPQELTTVR